MRDVRRRRRQLAEGPLQVSVEGGGRGPVLAEVVDVEVDEPGLLADQGRLAEVEPEIERDPHHQEQVGLREGDPAGARGEEAVSGGQHAPGHPVQDDGQAGGLGQPDELLFGVRPPDAGAGHDGGPASIPQQRDHLADGGGFRSAPTPCLRGECALEVADGHEDRPGAVAEGGVDRLGRHRVGVVGVRDGRGGLGQRADDRQVVHLLERPHAPAGHRRAAAEEEHRAVVLAGGGDGGHRVGHARPGGDRRHAAAARDLGPPLGSEAGGLLVADVHHGQVELARTKVEAPDVAAVQGEDGAQAGVPQRPGHQLSGRCEVSHRREHRRYGSARPPPGPRSPGRRGWWPPAH